MSVVPAGSLNVLMVDRRRASSRSRIRWRRLVRLVQCCCWAIPAVATGVDGVHPYPVDVSALGWLSDGAAALDPRFGYFLGESVAHGFGIVRAEFRDCRMMARWRNAAATADAPLRVLRQVWCRIRWSMRVVRCVLCRRAQAVVDCVRELLGREWVPAADAEPRPLAAEDCIVVAAYNAQVDCVREALIATGLADSSGAGVACGTVDKFQGQEAAVVLVSLASSRVDSGRGAGICAVAESFECGGVARQWQAVAFAVGGAFSACRMSGGTSSVELRGPGWSSTPSAALILRSSTLPASYVAGLTVGSGGVDWRSLVAGCL